MKRIFCTLLLTATLFTGFAQVIWPMFPKAEMIAPVKGQKIYVGLLDTSEQNCKPFAKSYNLSIQAALKSRWTFTSYRFVMMDSLIEMKENKDDILVMIPTEIEKHNYENPQIIGSSVYNKQGELILTRVGPFRSGKTTYSKTCWVMIGKAKDLKVKEKLFSKTYSVVFNNPVLGFMSSSFDYQSIVAGVAAMQKRAQYIISTKEEKDASNAADRTANAKLRTKTLYLDKDLLDKDLTEAQIKEVYTYPFKIVDYAEIAKAIDAKDPNVVFLHIDVLAQGQPKCTVYTKNTDKLDYNTIVLVDCGDTIGKKKLKEINELASRNK